MRSAPFKLGIVLLAHQAPDQLAMLISQLRHNRVTIYLHVDSATKVGPFRAALEARHCPQVTWLRSRRTVWGGIEIVDVLLDALTQGVHDDIGYIVVISGFDVPLKPIEEIVEFTRAAGDTSYLANWQLPTERWAYGGRARTEFYTYTLRGRRETCIPRGVDTAALTLRGRLLNAGLRALSATKGRREFPPYLRPVGGETWINLSRAAVDYTLNFHLAHPDYRRYHFHTLSADELFIPSIVLGSNFIQTHEVINDDLRFLTWPNHDASHPRMLTIDDLPAIVRSPDLFARKVDMHAEPELFDALCSRLAR